MGRRGHGWGFDEAAPRDVATRALVVPSAGVTAEDAVDEVAEEELINRAKDAIITCGVELFDVRNENVDEPQLDPVTFGGGFDALAGREQMPIATQRHVLGFDVGGPDDASSSAESEPELPQRDHTLMMDWANGVRTALLAVAFGNEQIREYCFKPPNKQMSFAENDREDNEPRFLIHHWVHWDNYSVLTRRTAICYRYPGASDSLAPLEVLANCWWSFKHILIPALGPAVYRV